MEGSGDTKTTLENGIKNDDERAVETKDKATTRKEDLPIDVNKRQAEENGDSIHKLVGFISNFCLTMRIPIEVRNNS